MTFLMTFSVVFVLFALFMFDTFSYGIYFVPFAAVPITVMIFFDSRTAVMTLFTTVMISAIIATFPFQFILMQVMVGFVATYSLRQLTRRSQLLFTAFMVFTTYVVIYVTTLLVGTGSLDTFSPRVVGMLAINCVLLSFAYFLILLVEKIFGFTSTVTLVELSDINNRLLRRLAEEAPGTFQHSMQVSTLASDAARAIEANVQMVRTGALYHDIGKLSSPIFFTENQHGVNPHDGLTPEASAHKIISHVTAGLQLAAKEKLPMVIRSFIAQHHGHGVAKYFYNTAMNSGYEVNKADFQYPGPNPQTKETTLLMMADAVEAASRSLHEYSEENISNLVENIINGQIADGLYIDSPISFHDIQVVKETFKTRLATIYHSRVEYPSLNK
jgi:putative nucleotidyltransferase with HDIG domain